MAQSTPSTPDTPSTSHLDEIDLESLRLVFGSASPEDLNNRKAHELRELWLQTTAAANNDKNTPTTTRKSVNSKMPRFLLDPKNEDHIAPHAVALQLLLGNRKGGRHQNNGDGVYRKVANYNNTSHKQHNSNSNSDSDGAHGCDDHESIHPSHRTTTTTTTNTTTTTTILHGKAMVWPLVAIATISLACQFVLEVFGGAGAIWGCAELIRLRKGGADDNSWQFFTYVALAVGVCCLLRFLLVHPFFPKATDPTFAEKHKLHDLCRPRTTTLFFELAQLVASDPVLFLHPTKGPALSSCCGCYCLCCGSRWSSFGDDNRDHEDDATTSDGQPLSSPRSLGKSSPQRWRSYAGTRS